MLRMICVVSIIRYGDIEIKNFLSYDFFIVLNVKFLNLLFRSFFGFKMFFDFIVILSIELECFFLVVVY